MKFLKLAKSVLNRITRKKHRRRTRITGKSRNRFGRNYYTEAERLIESYYGLSFKNPPPARAGEKRAEKRLKQHRKQWAKTPSRDTMTRQRRRAEARRAAKGWC